VDVKVSKGTYLFWYRCSHSRDVICSGLLSNSRPVVKSCACLQRDYSLKRLCLEQEAYYALSVRYLLVSVPFLYGLYEVLDVPARVPLCPLV
jgi:hypothetical protein